MSFDWCLYYLQVLKLHGKPSGTMLVMVLIRETELSGRMKLHGFLDLRSLLWVQSQPKDV